VRQDLHYALRILRHTPGFTAVAVATIALGIGGSTAIFSVVDSVLLRPLNFADSERLTMIRPTSGSRLSPAYFHDWRLESRSLQDMAGWHDVRANLTGRGVPLEVLVDRATSNFFAVLGTPALLGRTFTTGTDLSHVEPEVVLSHGFWQRVYGRDPGVIGRPVTLDGKIHTIVGVMPEGFSIRTTELAESRAELWMPFSLVPGSRVGMGGFLNVVARLAPGASSAQAQAELSAIARRIENEHRSYSRDWAVNVIPLLDATVKDVRTALLVLFGAVGILLLIACANVANLLLSRAATRQQELAIRRSLGATTGRLVRQFLTEGFVLAAAGGAIGVLLAMWGTQLLVSTLPAGFDLPRTREIDVDVRILVFAFLVTILTAILFGLVPTLSSAPSAPQIALRDWTRGSSSARSGNRFRGALIVSEVALALVLLGSAGLLGRSVWKLSRVDPGFQTERVLTMRTTLPRSKYDNDDRIRVFSTELLGRLESLPGIRSVGSVNYLPMSRFGAAAGFDIQGRPVARPENRPASWISVVGGRFFDVMEIPLLRGRLPGNVDSDETQPVFVIDEGLARRYWPGEDPIGARLIWPGGLRGRVPTDAAGSAASEERISGEIVGVVGSVRWRGMAADSPGTAYWWFPQAPGPEITIVARTVGDPIAMADAIVAQVGEIDPSQPVGEVRAMEDLVAADLAQPRFTLALLASFAAAALLLAAIGLYGVIAFAVTQRTREIGVRVALGARRRDVLRAIMQQGMRLIVAGLAIGTAAMLAVGPVIAGLLYGVTPTDPTTLLAAGLFLAAVATLAIYVPARRALRLDPMVALKAD
jgi:putative ABC transport system permease protein